MRHLCLVPLLGGFLLASPSWASEPPAPAAVVPAAAALVTPAARMQIQVLSDTGAVVSTASLYLPAGHGKVSASANRSSSRSILDGKKRSGSVMTLDGHVSLQIVGDDKDKSEWKISGEHIVVTLQTVDAAVPPESAKP